MLDAQCVADHFHWSQQCLPDEELLVAPYQLYNPFHVMLDVLSMVQTVMMFCIMLYYARTFICTHLFTTHAIGCGLCKEAVMTHVSDIASCATLLQY
jgi:hypothetical protein